MTKKKQKKKSKSSPLHEVILALLVWIGCCSFASVAYARNTSIARVGGANIFKDRKKKKNQATFILIFSRSRQMESLTSNGIIIKQIKQQQKNKNSGIGKKKKKDPHRCLKLILLVNPLCSRFWRNCFFFFLLLIVLTRCEKKIT